MEATVDVKSAWASKINWTQVISVLAMVLAWFGIDMPPDVRAAVITAISSIAAVATWVQRTWYTTAVTVASLQLADK